MATKSQTTLSLTSSERGPFFRGDPSQAFHRNVERELAELAKAGERKAAAALRLGQSHRAPVSRVGGRVADHVVGRTHALSGGAWRATAVVSISVLGVSGADRLALMAAGARVERATHGISQVNAAIAHEIRGAELLRGIDG